ncbi:MAG TPA: hypothetical protein VFL27_00210 [Candidatus Dormibacteraeota bacterium]|nr:hypothetical protein [Candidatus Dormibacteraeota bacterium]
MDVATGRESVAAFADEVITPSGWTVDAIRPHSNRMEPPDSYWSDFNLDISNKDGEKRTLRMVAKGALNPAAWATLSARLLDASDGRPCDPVNGVGYPRLFPETQHAYWFYPFDPAMANLPAAADPVRMAALLYGLDDPMAILAAGRRVEVERVRYVPEVGAILRYTINPGGVPIDIYGKVQPGLRGLRTFRVVEGLWRASAAYPGYLHLPRPLGYVEELNMLLEEGIRGKPVSARRRSTQFALMSEAAADALAVIHESRVEIDLKIDLELELARLDHVVEQFAYVHPSAHFMLRDLLIQIRDRVRKTAEEDILPTHGDMKYDQFVFHNDRFTLLDFDYYAQAETSYDLGKFCAYLVPSRPRDWRDSVAVEEARRRFLRRYMELRPQATLQRLGVYEASQFALRAMAFMWSQVDGWEELAEIYLAFGFERLKSRLPE